MTRGCKAKNRKGEPCGGFAVANSKYCFAHSPSRKRERSQARLKGGYNRRTAPGGDPENVPGEVRTLTDVLRILDFALGDALMLENSISRGRLLVAIAASYLSCIQEGEWEQRLRMLEEKANV